MSLFPNPEGIEALQRTLNIKKSAEEIWDALMQVVDEGNIETTDILWGEGIPDNAVGKNGDIFIRTINGAFYKREGGVWDFVGVFQAQWYVDLKIIEGNPIGNTQTQFTIQAKLYQGNTIKPFVGNVTLIKPDGSEVTSLDGEFSITLDDVTDVPVSPDEVFYTVITNFNGIPVSGTLPVRRRPSLTVSALVDQIEAKQDEIIVDSGQPPPPTAQERRKIWFDTTAKIIKVAEPGESFQNTSLSIAEVETKVNERLTASEKNEIENKIQNLTTGGQMPAPNVTGLGTLAVKDAVAEADLDTGLTTKVSRLNANGTLPNSDVTGLGTLAVKSEVAEADFVSALVTKLSKLQTNGNINNTDVNGLGTLATKNEIETADLVTALQTKLSKIQADGTIGNEDVNGLGGLAVKDAVDYNSSEVTNKPTLGTLATKSEVAKLDLDAALKTELDGKVEQSDIDTAVGTRANLSLSNINSGGEDKIKAEAAAEILAKVGSAAEITNIRDGKKANGSNLAIADITGLNDNLTAKQTDVDLTKDKTKFINATGVQNVIFGKVSTISLTATSTHHNVDIGDATIVYFDTGVAGAIATVTGILDGTTAVPANGGRIVYLGVKGDTFGGQRITLKDRNTGSAASNRFNLGVGINDYILRDGTLIPFVYDTNLNRWTCLNDLNKRTIENFGVLTSAEFDDLATNYPVAVEGNEYTLNNVYSPDQYELKKYLNGSWRTIYTFG